MIVVGWVCLHELYRLLARWRPVAVVGFAALAAMVLAARYGGLRGRCSRWRVATLPVLFLVVVARGSGARDGVDRRDAARRLLDRLCRGARRCCCASFRTATGS